VCIIAIGIASVYYTQKAQSDMQVEMFNRLIGGDDYCYLFVINPRGLSAAPVSILHPGHHPLHDVSVIIIAVPGPDATPEEQLRAALGPGLQKLLEGVVVFAPQVMLLGPMILALGYFSSGKRRTDRLAPSKQQSIAVPWFVVGFVGMMLFNSLDLIPQIDKAYLVHFPSDRGARCDGSRDGHPQVACERMEAAAHRCRVLAIHLGI
jgi:hypothetical protein